MTDTKPPQPHPEKNSPTLADRFKGWAVENPMKIYGTVFVGADVFYLMQGHQEGSVLWMTGTALGLIANTNKIVRGKGGEVFVLDKDFFSPSDLGQFMINSFQSAASVFTPRFWGEVLDAPSLSGADLKEQLKGALRFNPLDAGWLLTGTAGGLYMLDGLTRASETLPFEAMPVIVGASVLTGSAVGFLKNRPDLAGRIFTVATWTVLGFAAFNPEQMAFALASCPLYLAANYLITKVRPENQLSLKGPENTGSSP